mmetsp:Transcript_9001/g.29836  ORF Transcript_9001/g.29836 Transcript_9001/m.29836 type:complete len:270 (-) Transcript_9001:108-917(-)
MAGRSGHLGHGVPAPGANHRPGARSADRRTQQHKGKHQGLPHFGRRSLCGGGLQARPVTRCLGHQRGPGGGKVRPRLFGRQVGVVKHHTQQKRRRPTSQAMWAGHTLLGAARTMEPPMLRATPFTGQSSRWDAVGRPVTPTVAFRAARDPTGADPPWSKGHTPSHRGDPPWSKRWNGTPGQARLQNPGAWGARRSATLFGSQFPPRSRRAPPRCAREVRARVNTPTVLCRYRFRRGARGGVAVARGSFHATCIKCRCVSCAHRLRRCCV